MRFTKLTVKNFQAIESADIDFGPGLNIVFGPNDLGKSTLVRALRAALLVPPSSAEAGTFTPWNADAVPQVTLGFVDDEKRHWKIRKSFGANGGSAELLHSKDGLTFALEFKARQVEEQLRKMLGWGIPAPGGKGAPRGVPLSFLAHALMAEQTDVDKILSTSLQNDLDETGKISLTKALAALAQDPVFKRVLAQAQEEVDRYFTPKGQRRRGTGSPFLVAAALVKTLDEHKTSLTKQVQDAETVEALVARCREKRDHAQQRVEETDEKLARLLAQRKRIEERERAQLKLTEAEAELTAVDKQIARVEEEKLVADRLENEMTACDIEVARVRQSVDQAEVVYAAAEETLRNRNGDSERTERELRCSKYETDIAHAGNEILETERRNSAAKAALAALTAAKVARASVESSKLDVERGSEAVVAATQKVTDANAKHEFACALVAYARWRTAAEAQRNLEAERTKVTSLRKVAEDNSLAAAEKELEAASFDREVQTQRARLPEEQTLEELKATQRTLEMAEAALGGGLSINIRNNSKANLTATVDGVQLERTNSSDQASTIEAERRVVLSLEGLLDLEINAGALEKRREAERQRGAWSSSVAPVLARAGLTSLRAIQDEFTAIRTIESKAGQCRATAAQLRGEASSASEREAMCLARIGDLESTATSASEREDAIGTQDRTPLAAEFAKLGGSEVEAEKLQSAASKIAASASQDLTRLERALDAQRYKLQECETNSTRLEQEFSEAHAAISDVAVGAMEQAVDESSQKLLELAAARSKLAAELSALQSAGQTATRDAKVLFEAAAQKLATAKAELARVQKIAISARSASDAKRGEVSALRAELAKLNRSEVASAREKCATALDEFAGIPVTTDEDVAQGESLLKQARDALEICTRDLDQALGGLAKVGGVSVKEELTRTEEALQSAKERQEQLETDADSWQLLRDTLREVENEEGAHLGRALATPVAKSFVALTGGRYENLRLGATLQTEALDAHGVAIGTDVLTALSVGTRNQLATLIRITIAEQLKTSVVIDDHLVNTDTTRLSWFRDLLTRVSLSAQIIILTCRGDDYLLSGERPENGPTRDIAGGAIRALDASLLIKRWSNAQSVRPAV